MPPWGMIDNQLREAAIIEAFDIPVGLYNCILLLERMKMRNIANALSPPMRSGFQNFDRETVRENILFLSMVLCSRNIFQCSWQLKRAPGSPGGGWRREGWKEEGMIDGESASKQVGLLSNHHLIRHPLATLAQHSFLLANATNRGDSDTPFFWFLVIIFMDERSTHRWQAKAEATNVFISSIDVPTRSHSCALACSQRNTAAR